MSEDLIRRQDAIDAIDKHIGKFDAIETHYLDGLKDAMSLLKGLPSARPEIIRCKECKHWIPYDWMFSEVWQSKNIADYPEDDIGCDCCDMTMKANDYCSRAERRTDEPDRIDLHRSFSIPLLMDSMQS